MPSTLPLTLFERIRESCARVVDSPHSAVKVNADAIGAFVASLPRSDFEAASTTTKLPLRFPNVDAEINFIAIASLISFGSTYREDVHRLMGRGPAEAVLFGMLSMHISGGKLDTAYIRSLTIGDIASHFNIPLTTATEPMPGVTLEVPGPLRPFAEAILHVLQSTAELLHSHGYQRMSQFVVEAVRRGTTEGKGPAEGVVERLAGLFPAFNDAPEWDGKAVPLHSKAQRLVSELHKRVGPSSPELLFSDVDALTVFGGTSLPAVLRSLNILHVEEWLQDAIQDGQDISTLKAPSSDTPRDYDANLRAACVIACDEIVRRASSLPFAVTTRDLDAYLHQLAKEAPHSAVKRHVVGKHSTAV
eukprot:Opistho-1_new@94212